MRWVHVLAPVGASTICLHHDAPSGWSFGLSAVHREALGCVVPLILTGLGTVVSVNPELCFCKSQVAG
jgi:hypothetical protein